MAEDFKQQVETQERFEKLQRSLFNLGTVYGKDTFRLMVTFSPHFQMNVDVYCTVSLYGKDYSRTICGHPWFSVMGQEEPYTIWREIKDQ